jgi:DNA-binding transcriptional LysR family regulator
MRGLSWQHLEYFLAVARTQHMSRAAAEVGLSQPALSRAIASLENKLQVPLFERTGRSVKLNAYGETFRQRVERAMREIDDARSELESLARIDGGVVRLGFIRTLGIDFLPKLLSQFKEQFPSIDFAFDQDNSKDLERRLLDHELDLILCVTGTSQFTWVTIKEQELMLIVPPSHRLANVKEARFQDLKDEQFVTLKSGHVSLEILKANCTQAGFAPKFNFKGEGGSLVGFVSRGLGIALVSPEDAELDRVAAIRLTDPVPKRRIVMGWARDRSLSRGASIFQNFVLSNSEFSPAATYTKMHKA